MIMLNPISRRITNYGLKKLSRQIEMDAAEIDAITTDVLNSYERVLCNQQPFYRSAVIRTGVDLANAELKCLYFRALHVRAKYFFAVNSRKAVDKAKYQAVLTDLEEKVGILENLMKKGELYD